MSANRITVGISLVVIIAAFSIHEYSSTDSSEFEFDLNHLNDAERDRSFIHFDCDKDEKLSINEFKSLLKKLFYSTKLKKTYINEENSAKILEALNLNEVKSIARSEFNKLWKEWIKPILKPKAALIVVDVQNDFIADGMDGDFNGSMHLQNAKPMIKIINGLIDSIPFDAVVYTYDWHPSNHCSFLDSARDESIDRKIKDLKKSRSKLEMGEIVVYEKHPELPQKLWPTHCVQNTNGSKLYDHLKIAENKSVFVAKGMDPDLDSYSAFLDNDKKHRTEMAHELTKRGITDIYLTGVVYEFCVGLTAIDGLKEFGFRTAFIENAIQEISTTERNEMRKTLIGLSVDIIKSDDVLDMVEGRDRRLELEMGLILTQKPLNRTVD